MKKNIVSIDQIKKSILDLVGSPVNVKINRGRKKIERYSGEISGVYPSVFTLKLNNAVVKSLSCSYSDLICGEVVIKKA